MKVITAFLANVHWMHFAVPAMIIIAGVILIKITRKDDDKVKSELDHWINEGRG